MDRNTSSRDPLSSSPESWRLLAFFLDRLGTILGLLTRSLLDLWNMPVERMVVGVFHDEQAAKPTTAAMLSRCSPVRSLLCWAGTVVRTPTSITSYRGFLAGTCSITWHGNTSA